MTSIERFKALAAEERFKGWPVVGKPELGPKIPFFGQTLNYELETGNGIEPYTSIIRHFGWAVVFGITIESKVVTLCQWKPGVNQASWELPPGGIGKIDYEASIKDIADLTVSSYLKETGYQIKPRKLEHLGHIVIESGKYRGATQTSHGFNAHLFLATDLVKVGEARNPNPNEIMETLEVPVNEFPAVLESGLFSEESAVVCAYKAMIRLRWLEWQF
jgi:hypothetical protein